MRKPQLIFFGLVVLAITAVLTTAYFLLTGPRGKLVARVQKKDSGGYVHTVTVRQFAGRFNTELGDEGSGGRILPASSYEFYEGSDPITSANIAWPELHKFSVSFNNGVTVDCTWNETNYSWTRH